jgi:hypothetical protein
MSIFASGRNIVEVVFEVDGFYIHCVALAGYGFKYLTHEPHES